MPKQITATVSSDRLIEMMVNQAIIEVGVLNKMLGIPSQAARDLAFNELINNPRTDIMVHAGDVGEVVGPVVAILKHGDIWLNIKFPHLSVPVYVFDEWLVDPSTHKITDEGLEDFLDVSDTSQ